VSSLGWSRSRIVLAGVFVTCCLVLGLAPAGAVAFAQNPAWTVSAVASPTNFAPGDHSGTDVFRVVVTNSGDAPSNGEPVTITDTLPEGLVLDHAEVTGKELLSNTPIDCTGSTVLACTFSGVVPAGDELMLTIPVDVESEEPESLAANTVMVTGGGAAQASASAPVTVSNTPSPGFGVASFSNTLSGMQAGAHADMTTSFFFNTETSLSTAGGIVGGHLKDTVVDLPPGFAGDPVAVPMCAEAQLQVTVVLDHPACPVDSQVGTITIMLAIRVFGGGAFTTNEVVPVFNMQPLGGEVARLGFKTSFITSNIVIKVRPGDYGLEATAPNLVAGEIEVDGAKLTVWGVPALASHNLLRNTACEFEQCWRAVPKPGSNEEYESVPVGSGEPSTAPAVPFLSNATGCTGSTLPVTLRVDTWENRELPGESEPSATWNVGPLTGCERLEFNPGISVAATSLQAETPTGVNVGVSLPQSYENPVALATADLQNAVVTLPEGMTVNPSAGEGLGACTEAQFKAETLETTSGAGCPNDSSLGTVTIHTPVLTEEAKGSVFLATPAPFGETGHNPFNSLLAIYVVARIPNRGIVVKLQGQVTPNPVTGQLVTTFTENPQLPFDKFTLSFRPGLAAPLVTPSACGNNFTAQAQFTSWAQPQQLVSALSPPFPIEQGVGGGECPSGEVPPLNPQIRAGSYSAAAGSYSPFYLELVRRDGEQEITGFSTTMPPGLTGNLTGIPFCPEADIEAARRVTGREELEHPSCPAASEIGHTLVGAGVGPVLAQTPGKIYLAGPYHGAPFSVISITSATVGPFDLGTVVIRFPLQINHTTAQAEVQTSPTEPIPHIIKGIIVHVRDIRVYIDRPNFTINPTSCEPMNISATVTGAGANPANPADQNPVNVGEHFQVADCQNLAFKPKFKVSTSGHTSRADGASLTTTLTYPSAPLGTQANIAKVKVQLPKKLPSRLSTLQKACPAAAFDANPASCPAASRVGVARATTPIIPEPLTGPAYFVSHGGEAFPDLIVVLQGYGVTVDLVGSTFINEKTSITTSTFKTVPDVPVGTFELTLPQGPYSALAAHGDLCESKLAMPTEFVAQDGTTITQSTPIAVTGCPKHKAKKATHRSRRKSGKR
jgi:uncharacterized repeat protein (TIGR01451 family)